MFERLSNAIYSGASTFGYIGATVAAVSASNLSEGCKKASRAFQIATGCAAGAVGIVAVAQKMTVCAADSCYEMTFDQMAASQIVLYGLSLTVIAHLAAEGTKFVSQKMDSYSYFSKKNVESLSEVTTINS